MHSYDPDDAINFCPICAEKIAYLVWEFYDYGAIATNASVMDISMTKAIAIVAENKGLTVTH